MARARLKSSDLENGTFDFMLSERRVPACAQAVCRSLSIIVSRENVLQLLENLRQSCWIWSSHSYANGEGDQAQY